MALSGMAEEVINNAALYLSLLAVLAVSMFVGRQGVESTEDYVHALRGTVSEWRWLGLNIFSAGIGLWSFITIPEAGAKLGVLGVAAYTLASAVPLFLLGIIGPLVRQVSPDGVTITQFVRQRFGLVAQIIVSLLSLSYMAVCLMGELIALGVFLKYYGGIDVLVAQICICLMTAIYTSFSGMRASIFTDKIQGVAILSIMLLTLISCAKNVHVKQSSLDNSPLLQKSQVGLEALYTLSLAEFAGNTFNQGYWQRIYAAKSCHQLRRACLLAMVASAFVTFMIGTSGILSVISGISGPGDPLAFFRLIHSLPDYFNWIAIILVACLAASSIDTLQNSILITVITDFQVSSLPFARFLTALLNIPIVLFVHFKLDVYSVFYLICSMVFLPLLMGLVTHFNLQRRLDGIDFFVGVVLSCVSVITLGVVLNDGSIFKGFELLRLPLGISQSTPTFYAYVVGPIMSVFAMMVSSVLRLNWFIKIEGTKNDNDRGIQDAVIENTYLEDRGKGIV